MGSDDEWFDDFEEDSFGSDGGGAADSAMAGATSSADDSDGRATPLEGESGPSGPSPRRTPYAIVTIPGLAAMQREALAQVQGILGCSLTTARALLTFFSWDAESVLSTLAERGEEEVYRRAGVLPRAPEAATPPPGAALPAACAVCFAGMGPGEAVAMSCGHAFCADCWRTHLSIGVREGLGRRLACMAPGCGVLCEEDAVRRLLGDDAPLLARYEDTLVDGFVDDNRRVRWCPSQPHCGAAAAVAGADDAHCEVACCCGRQFCFACGEGPHSPATCAMLGAWRRRIADGTETSSWLSAHTKPCPKCSKPVEKNGGCNLVLCHCGQAFCWLCGQATGRAHTWQEIAGHSCGAYREEAESRQTEGQRALKRYLHYLTRYEAHLASLAAEERTRAEAADKVDAMADGERSLANFAWVTDALQQLFLARRVLAFSYVFAFYVFGPEFAGEFSPAAAATNKELFEDKQAQLEMEVERLAEATERSHQALAGARTGVVNLAASINSRIQKMYDVIENEIAPQVAGRSMDIAPYRGQRAKASGSAAAAVLAAVAARAGEGAGGAGSSPMLGADAPAVPAAAAPGVQGAGRPGSAGLKRQRQR